MKNKLFLICPDSHLEEPIRTKFPNNAYFLTALGAVFNSSEFNLLEDINYLIIQENIQEIVIVNSSSCRFINNVIKHNKGYNTKAEKELKKIYLENSTHFSEILNIKNKCTELARLNLIREKKNIEKCSVLKNKINLGLIQVSQVLYDKETNHFHTLASVKNNSFTGSKQNDIF